VSSSEIENKVNVILIELDLLEEIQKHFLLDLLVYLCVYFVSIYIFISSKSIYMYIYIYI